MRVNGSRLRCPATENRCDSLTKSGDSIFIYPICDVEIDILSPIFQAQEPTDPSPDLTYIQNFV